MSEYSYKAKQRWRAKAKRWIVEYGGGKCQVCGYFKCINNLSFHHIDPSKKDSEIGVLLSRSRSWDEILTEMKKCVLVCHNCHGEIHDNLIPCPAIDHVQREKSLRLIIDSRPVPKSHKFHFCKTCGKKITQVFTYCSQDCSAIGQRRVQWPLNLDKLVKSSSKRAVAKQLGVSDRAVDKHLKIHYYVVPTG